MSVSSRWSASVSSDCSIPPTSPVDALELYLGPSISSKDFINKYFQKESIFLPRLTTDNTNSTTTDNTNSTTTDMSTCLQQLGHQVFPLHYVTFLARSLELRFNENIRILRDGIDLSPPPPTPDQPQRPATYLQLHQALSEGATVTLVNVHRFVPQAYSLALLIQNALSVPTELDVLLYPPLAAGSDPHIEFEDVLLSQVAGRTDIALCDRKLLDVSLHDAASQQVVFAVTDLRTMNCNTQRLDAGDSLYVPAGVVHYATTPDGSELSVTHSWHLGRLALSVGDFLSTLAVMATKRFPKRLSSWLKERESQMEDLSRLVDTEVISNSIDNDDLPQGWKVEFQDTCVSWLRKLADQPTADQTTRVKVRGQETVMKMKTLLLKLAEDVKEDFSTLHRTLNDFRFKMASGLLADYSNNLCMMSRLHNGSSASGGLSADTHLYRASGVRVSLENKHNITVIQLELLHHAEGEELYAYRYCLGLYGSRGGVDGVVTANGKVFRVDDIPVRPLEKQREIAVFLISIGALSVASDEVVKERGRVEEVAVVFDEGTAAKLPTRLGGNKQISGSGGEMKQQAGGDEMVGGVNYQRMADDEEIEIIEDTTNDEL
eukprot:GHVS01061814.1.p1 GENE.GHVS01061814.1~~GHVS01061814.1.p1  ORF type:complete len:699 (+),score=156.24 GHVS01061814.1:286-2097(+)